jgi:hypothetical protein
MMATDMLYFAVARTAMMAAFRSRIAQPEAA